MARTRTPKTQPEAGQNELPSVAIAEESRPLMPAEGPEQGMAPLVEAPPKLTLEELVERLPTEPGVYMMKDKKGRIIYVGKASNLKNRVRSYFSRSGDSRPFVALLERLLSDIETIVTTTEKEALLLENNLIKAHRPRFNVKLVDDKNFLVLRLDDKVPFPRLEVVRKIRDDRARYFGPYHSATSCRQTLEVVNRHFKLRTCTDQVMQSRKRPCLQYQIKRCDAPCVFPVDRSLYAEQVRDVALFLDGKDDELVRRLRSRMMDASKQMEYEIAAVVRDQVQALEHTLEEQRVVSAKFIDQDIFGYYREGDLLEIAVLHIRQGKLLGRRTYHFSGQEFPDEESISSFVGLYYDLGNIIPDEVLLPVEIEDAAAKQEWLRERAQAGQSRAQALRKKVEVLCPKRGPKAKLVELANKNAQAAMKSRRDKRADMEESLEKLQRRLSLKKVPRRIECFDISHMQGSHTVASMVVFEDGEPVRREYRTYKIRSVRNDDFAAMYEVISRRMRRAKEVLEGEAEALTTPNAPAGPAPEKGAENPEILDFEEEGGERSSWALPDLLVIDGGKGQLGSALAAIKDIGIDMALIDVISLAKERETEDGDDEPDRVFLPKVKDPIRLRQNTAELFVLSRIRDEAHRIAVTFHGKQRTKYTLRSQLAEIPGVGPKRQRELIAALGSVKRIREASLEDLLAVPGITKKVAEAIFSHFQRQTDTALDPNKENDPDQELKEAENASLSELSALSDAADGASEIDAAEDRASLSQVIAQASRKPEERAEA